MFTNLSGETRNHIIKIPYSADKQLKYKHEILNYLLNITETVVQSQLGSRYPDS